MAKETEVLIVGAGPVGLLTALALAEHGVAVEIVDEEWRPSVHNYAVALHPASLALLEELGVAGELIREGRRVDTLAFYEGAERRAQVSLAKTGGRFPFVLALPQSVLEGALEDRLLKHKVSVGWNRRVSALALEDGKAVATVDTLERVAGGYAFATSKWVVDRTTKLTARFVVGADGHHSLVRRSLDFPFPVVSPSELYGVFEFSCDGAPAEEVCVVLDGDTASALWPLPENYWRWSFKLDDTQYVLPPRGERRVIVQIGQRAYPHIADEKLAELVAARAPWFDRGIAAVTWSVAVRFERRLASRFGRDNVWLAGDAAHLTGPLGAQSMNAGLREAHELATRLAAVLKGSTGAEPLEAYNRDRTAEWQRLLGLQGGAREMSGSGSWAAKRWPRLLSCLPATGDALGALASQLGLELTD
jgi:2-polyprenyl-6-methoxyphenol hydroxylase-like FAD-dependent oxidoreductase